MPQPENHAYHVIFRGEGLKGELQDFKMPAWSPGFYRIGDFSRNVSNFRAVNGAEGLQDVRIIDAILESRDKGRPVAISSSYTGRRPTLKQEIHKPAVKNTKLVRATSPAK